MKPSQHAFTLVELSIVLVILGLLVGGVLTGQSLIRAAELRSVSTQYARYVTATQTFRDKYMALPGDMLNAQSYWGIAAAGGACESTPSTDTKTCNGNGDGRLQSIGTSNEQFRFWQHLANAGLIEGTYDGIIHASASTIENSPVGKINSSLWFATTVPSITAQTFMFDGVYDNLLQVGGVLAGQPPYNPIFKPEEVYNIDMKMDDGMPATGKLVVRAQGGLNLCTDTSTSSVLTANYLLTRNAISCSLYFRQAF